MKRTVLWALSLLVLTGCASTDQSLPTPTVTLPLHHAGVTDDRHRFHAFLAQELGSKHVASSLLHLDGAECPLSEPKCAPSEASGKATQLAKMSSTAVVLVPGIFYDCLGPPLIPFASLTNAAEEGSTARALEALRESSNLASVSFAPIGGRISSAENAAVISQHLLAIAENPSITDIYVLGYSKGVADSLQALVQLDAEGRLPSKIKAFVSLAGAVMGSDRADSGVALYRLISTGFQGSTCPKSSRGQEVTDLTRLVRQAWLASNELPASVQLYSVAAYTSREKTHPLLRSSFDALVPIDPRNDGQVATSLALLPKSSMVAFVDSDHWEFVLPLEEHPSWFIRGYFSGYEFPRVAFFKSLIRFIRSETK